MPKSKNASLPSAHDAEVSGVRVGVEKAVFKQLLEVCLREQVNHFVRVVARRAKLVRIDDLYACDELHHDQVAGRKRVVDLRHIDLFPLDEVLAERLGVARLLLVVHLFGDGRVKLIERPLPIYSANQVRVAFEHARDSSQHA